MLNTLKLSAGDLVAHAEVRAAALGHPRVGTGHLLLAMLELDAGHCSELLRHESLRPDEVIARAGELDGEEIGDEEDTLPPPRTAKLTDIACVALEHAVMLESRSISADHLLLAVAVNGDCTAADILYRNSEDARERINHALIDSLADGESAARAALTITAREATLVAWSRALAIGSAEIGMEDLLHGISAPGWTIGARAMAALGTVPDWAPAEWRGNSNEDPYRRIPFDDTARGALQWASEETRRLGRAHTGTEHLLLAASQVAIGELAAFVGAGANAEEVRDAVANAVNTKEAAQDAEARQRGWQPEQEERHGSDEKLLAAAREVVEFAGGTVSDVEPIGCWPGLVAAAYVNEDEDLTELLDDMELEPTSIHSLAKEEPDLPLADAIARAQESQPGEDLEPLDVILTILAQPSQRVTAALDRLGLTANETLAQLAEWRLKRDGDVSGSPSVVAASALNLLMGMITSVALLQVAISEGAWWKLVFLPLIWTGHPAYGPVGSTVVSGVLAFAVSPLVGGLHLAGIPFDVIQARAERQAIWARTGVHLTLRELRCTSRRVLGLWGAMNQGLRQIIRGTVHSGLRKMRLRRG